MNWHDLRFVLAVARTGSFAEAARRLGVDPTTAGRRVAASERALGKPLFERSADGLRCTPAGEAAAATAARMEAEVAALQRGADADWTREVVRLTAPPLIVNRLLVPALRSAEDRLPRIELVAEARNLSFSKREADLALRFARPESGPAVTRRLANLDYAVYGTRDADASLPWLTYDGSMDHLEHARWSIAAAGDEARLAFNDAESMIRAACKGAGKALLPCFAADAEPVLARIGGVVLARELWLVVHEDVRARASVTAVADWVSEAVALACSKLE